jgi:hypothetical protein
MATKNKTPAKRPNQLEQIREEIQRLWNAYNDREVEMEEQETDIHRLKQQVDDLICKKTVKYLSEEDDDEPLTKKPCNPKKCSRNRWNIVISPKNEDNPWPDLYFCEEGNGDFRWSDLDTAVGYPSEEEAQLVIDDDDLPKIPSGWGEPNVYPSPLNQEETDSEDDDEEVPPAYIIRSEDGENRVLYWSDEYGWISTPNTATRQYSKGGSENKAKWLNPPSFSGVEFDEPESVLLSEVS